MAPPPPELTVDVDRRLLEIVIGNVLDNSLKFSSGQSRPVEAAIEPGEDEIRIVVRDYGPGIPAEWRAAVFEPFFRLDRSRQRETGGYGLGLSLCRKIVTAHHGRIEVFGEPCPGISIVIALPRRQSNRRDAGRA